MGGAIAHIKLTACRQGVSSPDPKTRTVTPVTAVSGCPIGGRCGSAQRSTRSSTASHRTGDEGGVIGHLGSGLSSSLKIAGAEMTTRGAGRGIGGREEAVTRRVRAAEASPGAEERPVRVAAAGAPAETILVAGSSGACSSASRRSRRHTGQSRVACRKPAAADRCARSSAPVSCLPVAVIARTSAPRPCFVSTGGGWRSQGVGLGVGGGAGAENRPPSTSRAALSTTKGPAS